MKGVNKFNHPIHNPLLLVMEPRTPDILVSEVIKASKYFGAMPVNFYPYYTVSHTKYLSVTSERYKSKLVPVIQ
jgi:hypothetical protein